MGITVAQIKAVIIGDTSDLDRRIDGAEARIKRLISQSQAATAQASVLYASYDKAVDDLDSKRNRSYASEEAQLKALQAHYDLLAAKKSELSAKEASINNGTGIALYKTQADRIESQMALIEERSKALQATVNAKSASSFAVEEARIKTMVSQYDVLEARKAKLDASIPNMKGANNVALGNVKSAGMDEQLNLLQQRTMAAEEELFAKKNADFAVESAHIADLNMQWNVLYERREALEERMQAIQNGTGAATIRKEIAHVDSQMAVNANRQQTVVGNINAGKADNLEAEQAKVARIASQINANVATAEELQVRLTNADAELSKMGGNGLQRFARSTGEITANMAGLVTLVGIGSTEMASKFQFMTQSIANNTTMGVAGLDAMRASIVKLSSDTGTPLDQLTQGYMHITNFGYDAANAQMILSAANKSSVATGTDAAQTANILAGTLHQFSQSGKDAAVTMNILHLAAAQGNTTLEQFTAYAGAVIAQAANMKVSLVDVSAAISTLTRHGYDAARAATQVQDVMVRIANPTAQAAKEIARISRLSGVDLVHDFTAAGLASKGIAGVMADVRRAVGDNTDSINLMIPALRGGLGAMVLAGVGAHDYGEEIKTLQSVYNGFDPTQQGFQATMATTTQKFAQLRASIENEFIPVGDKLADVFLQLGPVLHKVADVTLTVMNAFTAMPRPLQDAILLFGSLKVASALMYSPLFNVAGLLPKINAGTLEMTGGFQTFRNMAGGTVGALDRFKRVGADVLTWIGNMRGATVLASTATGANTAFVTANATAQTAQAAAATSAAGALTVEASAAATLAISLGVVALAVAAAAAAFVLWKADIDMATEAMDLNADSAQRDQATQAGWNSINKTGDAKKDLIGTAQLNAQEMARIDTERKEVQKRLGFNGGRGWPDPKKELADQQRLADLNRDYDAQKNARQTNLANASKITENPKGGLMSIVADLAKRNVHPKQTVIDPKTGLAKEIGVQCGAAFSSALHDSGIASNMTQLAQHAARVAPIGKEKDGTPIYPEGTGLFFGDSKKMNEKGNSQHFGMYSATNVYENSTAGGGGYHWQHDHSFKQLRKEYGGQVTAFQIPGQGSQADAAIAGAADSLQTPLTPGQGVGRAQVKALKAQDILDAKAAREKESAVKHLASAYTSENNSLNEQILMHGKSGEAAKIHYEVTKGALAGLAPAEKAHLEHLARELDIVRQRDKTKSTLESFKEHMAVLELPKEERHVVQAMGGPKEWSKLSADEKSESTKLFDDDKKAEAADKVKDKLQDLQLAFRMTGAESKKAAIEAAGGWDVWKDLGSGNSPIQQAIQWQTNMNKTIETLHSKSQSWNDELAVPFHTESTAKAEAETQINDLNSKWGGSAKDPAMATETKQLRQVAGAKDNRHVEEEFYKKAIEGDKKAQESMMLTKTATSEADIEIKKVLDDWGVLATNGNVQKYITMLKEAARAEDAAAASASIRNIEQGFQTQHTELTGMQSGAGNSDQTALLAFLIQNKDTIEKLRASFGADKAGADAAEQKLAMDFLKSIGDMKMISGLKQGQAEVHKLEKELLQLRASNPYDALKVSMMEWNDVSKQFELPPGLEASLPLLEKMRIEIEAVTTASSVLGTAFSKSFTDKFLPDVGKIDAANQAIYSLQKEVAKDPYNKQLQTVLNEANSRLHEHGNQIAHFFKGVFQNITQGFIETVAKLGQQIIQDQLKNSLSGLFSSLLHIKAPASGGAASGVGGALANAQQTRASLMLLQGATMMQSAGMGLQTAAVGLHGSSALEMTGATTLTTGSTALSTAAIALTSSATMLTSAAGLLSASATSSMFGGFYADGGDFMGGAPIIVGERGPELIVPKAGGTVIPNHKAFQGNSGGQQSAGFVYAPNVVIHAVDAAGVQRAHGEIMAEGFQTAQMYYARNR